MAQAMKKRKQRRPILVMYLLRTFITMPYPSEISRLISLASVSLKALKKTLKTVRGKTRFPLSLKKSYSRNVTAHSMQVIKRRQQK